MAKNEAMQTGSTYTLTLRSGKTITGTYQQSHNGTHYLSVDGGRCGVHATDVVEIGAATTAKPKGQTNAKP